MTYAIPLWEPPGVPVVGSEAIFPVRRILCVGKNYAAHTREMGGDPTKSKPVFFTKSPHNIQLSHGVIKTPFPPMTDDLHHELELVVAIGEDSEVFGYAIGMDFTKRDLQAAAKEKGGPWDMSKSFTCGAPMGPIHPVVQTGILASGKIELAVNGEVRQSGDLADMIYSVPEIIGHLNSYDPLLPGDLIFTGTPSGVGQVTVGDKLSGTIEGLGTLEIEMVNG